MMKYPVGTLVRSRLGAIIHKVGGVVAIEDEVLRVLIHGESNTEFVPLGNYFSARTVSDLDDRYEIFTPEPPLPAVVKGDILRSRSGDLFIVVDSEGQSIVYRISGEKSERTWTFLHFLVEEQGPLEIVTNNAGAKFSKLLDR